METYKGAVCSYRKKGRDTQFRGQDFIKGNVVLYFYKESVTSKYSCSDTWVTQTTGVYRTPLYSPIEPNVITRVKVYSALTI